MKILVLSVFFLLEKEISGSGSFLGEQTKLSLLKYYIHYD